MRILINRTDAIGDTLLSMPVAQMIKEKFPDAYIAFIINPICKDLFDNHPYVDETFSFDKKQSLFNKIKNIKIIFENFNPDTYFYLGGSHLVSAFAFFKNINFRGGLKSRALSFLFLNRGIRQKRSIVSMHEVDYNLKVIEPLGIEYSKDLVKKYPPVITIDKNEADDALLEFNKSLENLGLDSDKEKIFIHPGMTGHTLNWSSRNYARLVVRLEQKFPKKFLYIISHTPSDEPFLTGLRDFFDQEININFQKNLFYFNGAIKGLKNYMQVLMSAKVFIGPSTGTLHIANTLNIPCVGIYSPIRTQSSFRWGPFKRGDDTYTKIIVPDVVCGEQIKCVGTDCPYYLCMDKVEVDDVLNKILPLLEKK